MGKLQVKLAGLDVYSGYWLAVDAPSTSIEDPLQEEGIDTLRRVMEAAGILKSGELPALPWKREGDCPAPSKIRFGSDLK